MRKITVSDITISAALAALSVILEFVSIRTESSKISIYCLPLLFAGLLFGPLIGWLTGLVSSFISQLIFHGLSITTPIWMLAPMAWGFISGLLYYLLFKEKFSLKSILITILFTSILVTLINTLALYLDGLIFHYPTPYVLAQFGSRMIRSILFCILYIVVIYFTLPRIKKAISR